MAGFYEHYLKKCPMSGYYRENAEKMKQYSGKWEEFYRLAESAFSYLAVKTRIAEEMAPAYKRGDRQLLGVIAEELLPQLHTLIREVRDRQYVIWKKYYHQNGWWNCDYFYGGMLMRCESARSLLQQYLTGEIDSIHELEEEHLSKNVNAFTGEKVIAMPLLK